MTDGRSPAAIWMGGAFCTALALAITVLAVFGPGERGTDVALQATGRLSFVLFWPAYAGGGLATFGPVFAFLPHRARDFGLAFASAHLVHLALVGWLSYIGPVPALGTFVFFGIAVFWTYLLALLSSSRLQRIVGRRGWPFIRLVGVNYIAYAFAVDFLRVSPSVSYRYIIGYLPFAVLSLVGPMLYLLAFAQRTVWSARQNPH